jgi:hypothetical protein
MVSRVIEFSFSARATLASVLPVVIPEQRCTLSINFAGTLRMTTLAGDLDSRLNGLAVRATILATVCCQTTAAWVCTTILVFVAHNNPF